MVKLQLIVSRSVIPCEDFVTITSVFVATGFNNNEIAPCCHISRKRPRGRHEVGARCEVEEKEEKEKKKEDLPGLI